MIYTEKIKKAINLAIKTHEIDQKQKRKGKDVAYISHPLIVGLLLSRAGADEDVIVAGILHDTIEDSLREKKVTSKMIQEGFGGRVADLVGSVTESKNLPWKQRKQEVIEKIKNFSESSLLLKSADVVANVSEIIDDYNQNGHKEFEEFSAPEPKKENTLGQFLNVMSAILERDYNNPLKNDLETSVIELKKIK